MGVGPCVASDVKLLITGATGFIGSRLLVELLLRSKPLEDIFLLLRKSPDKNSLLYERLKAVSLEASFEKLQFIECDFSDPSSFRAALDGAKLRTPGPWTLCHLAALIKAKGDRGLQRRLNQGVTEDLGHWATKQKAHFIFMSSVVAFGGAFSKQPRTEKDFSKLSFLNKFFSYYSSKRLAHEALWKRRAEFPVSILCPGIVHGALEDRKDSRSHIRALLKGTLPFAPPGGGNFISLDKVVGSILEEIDRNVSPEGHLRLLVDENMDFHKYFQLLSTKYSKRPRKIYRLPFLFVFMSSPFLFFATLLGLAPAEALLQASMFLYFESSEPISKGLSVGPALDEAFGKK